jgi:tRNA(Ile)-lysidine synthase
MPRSHPPTLLTLARRTIVDERLFGRNDAVLVAVSAGPDSMALLHVLARLRRDLGFTLVAHGVDHGLRAEAASELDLAARFAATLDVPFERTRVDVSPGGNLQARARAARYAALRDAALRDGAARIATAHHAADRAETVLLRLLRGAGPRGLAVLPPRQPAFDGGADGIDLVRPFLRASRAAIDAHVARHAVPFARDPSNADPRFLRVRVRNELLPLLRALSPRIDEHLCALADQLAAPSSMQSSVPSSLEAGDPRSDAPLAGVPLSRASRDALRALVATRSPRARVALKRGLVARWDAAVGGIEVRSSKRRREKRDEEEGADLGVTQAPRPTRPRSR